MDERLLTGTMKINEKNHLEVGGIDTIELVNKYGTPSYVYDIEAVKQKARAFKAVFSKRKVKAQVAYASKAFSCLAIYQLMAKEGLSLDVVSGGELYTAIKAEYPSEKIHFHGNNKSDDEMFAGLDYQVGCFVVDNFYELDRLNQFTSERKQRMKILIRVTPGVEAHTHDYISTGQNDSKFGFDLENGQAKQAAILASQMPYIDVIGLHSHIGSQIFELEGFNLAINKMLTYSKKWKEEFGFDLSVLNVGGGFGIQYTVEDEPLSIAEYIDSIITEVENVTDALGLNMPEIWIEPGRSLVGDAGMTLYETGSQKSIPDVRHYLAIDGGMSDNIRPALYHAKYTGVLANRANDQASDLYSIAGKCCESGDMLIWDLPLPKPQKKDILAVFSTGAYGYAMASNYNRIPRPPVIFVENGSDFLAIQRETYNDLMRLEHSLLSNN
ncbi:diaminopimelate decarboxylase [Carnobacterium iners]|uniref:Diaminopimelate decarboxylase n=1 Tax=Carnobacterium iners TaxID=1073423 RepID=A0A1X7NCL6_9LACT|nr:diaminopimelate decarboxylase [Carnobacterium iners]SEK35689.1 diaminopimelate decarboxylase [Carnobacterium iners]SMH35356.1 diaminopimelate decarboxylase [Carnobacterium iners]